MFLLRRRRGSGLEHRALMGDETRPSPHHATPGFVGLTAPTVRPFLYFDLSPDR